MKSRHTNLGMAGMALAAGLASFSGDVLRSASPRLPKAPYEHTLGKRNSGRIQKRNQRRRDNAAGRKANLKDRLTKALFGDTQYYIQRMTNWQNTMWMRAGPNADPKKFSELKHWKAA